MKYRQIKDGEPFTVPNKRLHKLVCCDCGLVHQIVFVADGQKAGVPIGVVARRDNRATAQRRRWARARVPNVRVSDGANH